MASSLRPEDRSRITSNPTITSTASAPSNAASVEADGEYETYQAEVKKLENQLERYSPKGTLPALILSLFHLHYFYVGRIGRGIICLLTANFFYIGFIIDLLRLLFGRFKDAGGRYVNTAGCMRTSAKLDALRRNPPQRSYSAPAASPIHRSEPIVSSIRKDEPSVQPISKTAPRSFHQPGSGSGKSVDDLWNEYLACHNQPVSAEKMRILTECSKQQEDTDLQRAALCDKGLILVLGTDGWPKEEAEGTAMIRKAAEMGDTTSMNYYGNLLTRTGDIECFDWFCKAIVEGCDPNAAESLKKYYAVAKKPGHEDMRRHVDEVAKRSIEKIRSTMGNTPEAGLAIGLLAVAGTTETLGISAEKGKELIILAERMGNDTAKIVMTNYADTLL